MSVRTLLLCDECVAGVTMPHAASPRTEAEAQGWTRTSDGHDLCPRCGGGRMSEPIDCSCSGECERGEHPACVDRLCDGCYSCADHCCGVNEYAMWPRVRRRAAHEAARRAVDIARRAAAAPSLRGVTLAQPYLPPMHDTVNGEARCLHCEVRCDVKAQGGSSMPSIPAEIACPCCVAALRDGKPCLTCCGVTA